VRRSHPIAAPLYTHLVVLERVLQDMA
jgi:hypothetical protein